MQLNDFLLHFYNSSRGKKVKYFCSNLSPLNPIKYVFILYSNKLMIKLNLLLFMFFYFLLLWFQSSAV